MEPSYDSITNNRNITQESNITIGKCGHMYHSDCINSWLKTSNTCPIDKVEWQTFRIADSFTKLVLKDKDNKLDNFSNSTNKKKYFSNRENNNYPVKYKKMPYVENSIINNSNINTNNMGGMEILSSQVNEWNKYGSEWPTESIESTEFTESAWNSNSNSNSNSNFNSNFNSNSAYESWN